MHLENIWREIDNCEDCKKERNHLSHIHGGGKEKNPDIMLLFINPTHRNISSHPGYSGPRFPFIGTNHVWSVLARAGVLSGDLLGIKNPEWNKNYIRFIQNELRNNSVYITNVVKCTGANANNPSKTKVSKTLGLLHEEIKTVNPKLIVAMGLLPFNTLVHEPIKLSEVYRKVMKGKLMSKKTNIGRKEFEIQPCYFPIGRGNPRRASEMLHMIRNSR